MAKELFFLNSETKMKNKQNKSSFKNRPIKFKAAIEAFRQH